MIHAKTPEGQDTQTHDVADEVREGHVYCDDVYIHKFPGFVHDEHTPRDLWRLEYAALQGVEFNEPMRIYMRHRLDAATIVADTDGRILHRYGQWVFRAPMIDYLTMPTDDGRLLRCAMHSAAIHALPLHVVKKMEVAVYGEGERVAHLVGFVEEKRKDVDHNKEFREFLVAVNVVFVEPMSFGDRYRWRRWAELQKEHLEGVGPIESPIAQHFPTIIKSSDAVDYGWWKDEGEAF